MKIQKLIAAVALAALTMGGAAPRAEGQEAPWTYWLGAGAFFLEGVEPNYGGQMYEARLGYDLDPNLTLEYGLGGSPFMEGRDYPAPSSREGTFNSYNSPGENWFVKTNIGALWHFIGNDEDRTIDPYVSVIGGTNYYGKWRDGSNWSPFYGPGTGVSYWFSRDAAIRGDYSLLFAQDGKQQINHSAMLMGFYRFGGEGDMSQSSSRNAKENTNELGQRSSGPLKTIYFNYDKSDIRGDQQSTLTENAAWMKNNPAKKVSVEGHCDERGTNEYNMALGARRAKSAYDFLRTLGVPKEQMSSQTYGEEMPAVQGHDESAWSKNRRVESVLKP